jgi:hypothetical protein
MAGNPNEVRDLMPSLNRVGSPAKCVAVSAWLSNTSPARLDEEARIDKGGCNPDGYSIAFDDQLLMTAQSGDHQAFIELCRRHSPMVKKRIFSIVRKKMLMTRFRTPCFEPIDTWAPFAVPANSPLGSPASGLTRH